MKVLVAEDDITSRRMIEVMLRKWEYEVIVVCDGDQAWKALQVESPPELAILDWMMPGMDGVEICRKVRESVTSSLTYIMLLTGRDCKEDIVSGLAAGADDYVTKPFEPEELHARIKVGERIVKLQIALSDRVKELQEALAQIKTLRGLLPICARCHKIRDDQQVWQRLEQYVVEHSDAKFSHSICPECAKSLYPELYDREE
jgi:DNA-binding response OmpR family regulator